MKQITGGQVQLSKLIFTHNWEDPAVDEQALQIKKGDTVFTITSGGCNTLSFLRFEPAAIYCVDINPAQTYIMELKKAVFKNLTSGETWAFMGLVKSKERLYTYEKLKHDLSADAQNFFDNRKSLLHKGIIMSGRYEQFVKIASRLLRLMQGSAKTRKLFQLPIAEQQQFYKKYWDNRRWRWLFSVMFNKKQLAKKGLNADYFHFDDGSTSFSESFHRRATHAMTELPLQSNYFLALYLLGKYNDIEQIPDYLRPVYFDTIKAHIDNVHPVTSDSKYWLEQQPDNLFNAMALSNICELMDAEDTHKLFSEVLRTAKPGARIIFRNLMIPREVPDDLRNSIIKDDALSKELQFNDRSFVYGKVAAYTIHK
jgi:S-adenosylmethionine-diacylglycerol 3-amino-3-carboxypropyl transferase